MSAQKIKPVNAILVRLKLKTFANSREDKPMTGELEEKHALLHGAVKAVKVKFPKELLAPIKKTAGELDRWNRDHTLPWELGCRLLNLRHLGEFNSHMSAEIGKLSTMADAWCEPAAYAAHIAAAKEMHKATFRLDDYPPQSDIRHHFIFSCEHDPLPDAKSFALLGIGEQTVANMQAELEQRTQAKVADAMSAAWEKILAPLRKLVETMRDKKPIFHDTLVSNIMETLDLMPALNLTGSQDLVAAAAQIREVMKNISAETLRDNIHKRNAASAGAQELINRFGKLGERKFSI